MKIPLSNEYIKTYIVKEKEQIYEENESTEKFKNDIKNILNSHLIPKEIYVSTMTVTCKFENLKFNCCNIAKYLDLKPGRIESVVCSLDDKRKNNMVKNVIYRFAYSNIKKKEKNLEKKVFYNQVSIEIKVKSKIDDGLIHVKLFSNGSIQMTGCQSVENIHDAITELIESLKHEKFIIIDNKLVEMPFVSDKNLLNVSCVYDLCIKMINTNFKIKFCVNLPRLYELYLAGSLNLEEKIKCIYNPMSHSCIDIKYYHGDKKISIFIFEAGSIVITGAKNGEHIKLAYEFVNKFLYSNYKKIVKKNIVVKKT